MSTYTPAELVAQAETFKSLVVGDPAAPGSMIGLWLATADALANAMITLAEDKAYIDKLEARLNVPADLDEIDGIGREGR